jgi:nucleoside-diphosphate-sugar epimerase
MEITISGARLELGRVLAAQRLPRRAGAVHINLLGQQANTLLHDGHAWGDAFPRTMLAGTRRALRVAQAQRADFFVHASFAFVDAVLRGAKLEPPLADCADAILAAEALVRDSPLPACIVRLGWLYGPQSADLLAYRTAFRLGRPYWSGPKSARQYHLHQLDAAAALVAAATPKNAGKTFYATDGHPRPFMQFMDAFARRVGRATPLHLPQFAHLLARVIIRKEHMQQVALPMPARAPQPGVPRWSPRYGDYAQGLDEVIAAWGATD